MSNMSDAQKMQIIEDLKIVVRDVQSLLHTTATDCKESSDDIKNTMTHKLSQAVEQIHQLEHFHRERLMHSVQKAQTYVASHPVQAVGVFAVVGVLIGLLIKRK